jgi:hypothetical protein
MATESFESLERFYEKPDPWDFQASKDDHFRRMVIARIAGLFVGGSARTLDLGAGEGWVTNTLPGNTLHGFEISDRAASRMPHRVKRVAQPEGMYDLVVASGVLYKHYDTGKFFDLIQQHAGRIILTCNIKTWEVADLAFALGPVREIFTAEFPYREYVQKLRVFEVGK